jgi:hypothetical protein
MNMNMTANALVLSLELVGDLRHEDEFYARQMRPHGCQCPEI